MAKKCPKCKYFNKDTASACSLCSEALPKGPGSSDDQVNLAEGRQLRGGQHRARMTRMSDDRVHFLVPPSGEYVKLDAGPRFVLGRDPRCSLVVNVEEISRQHCEILWYGDPKVPSVRDIESQNGTFLNGVRLEDKEERELRSGDLIRMGSGFIWSYRHMRPHELDKILKKEQKEEDTSAIRLPPEIGGGGGGGALSGDFAALPAGKLMLLLELLGVTGTLDIDCNGNKGFIEIVQGAPTDVQYAGISGVTAVVALSALEEGRFSFKPG